MLPVIEAPTRHQKRIKRNCRGRKSQNEFPDSLSRAAVSRISNSAERFCRNGLAFASRATFSPNCSAELQIFLVLFVHEILHAQGIGQRVGVFAAESEMRMASPAFGMTEFLGATA